MQNLGDFLNLPPAIVRLQWEQILERDEPTRDKRGSVFAPIETILCVAASFVVNHKKFSSKNRGSAGTPIPELAHLFRRSPDSLFLKFANFDGSRPNGAKWDRALSTYLTENSDELASLYRIILYAARDHGISKDLLPDFLELESGGEFNLLGQDILNSSAVETLLAAEIPKWSHQNRDVVEGDTIRQILATARRGQHGFSVRVLANCGNACVFCGMTADRDLSPRMLVASHIKPRRDSKPYEELDHRNGFAACPIHDVAFDSGLITVNGGLKIHLSESLKSRLTGDSAASHYFDSPPMFRHVQLPRNAVLPTATYLKWHNSRIFTGILPS